MKRLPTIAHIYVLLCPDSGSIRYVGWTSMKLNLRLNGHRVSARKKSDLGNRTFWIRKLLRRGQSPRIRLVQDVPWEDRARAEIYWIAYFKSLGCDLTNSTLGGECPPGMRGRKHSAESRAKMGLAWVGRKHTPETRAKVSAARKGVRLSEEHRAAISAGQRGSKRSPEARAKMSAAARNRSPEYRAKIAAANARRVWTEESKRKNSESQRRAHAERVAKKARESGEGV